MSAQRDALAEAANVLERLLAQGYQGFEGVPRSEIEQARDLAELALTGTEEEARVRAVDTVRATEVAGWSLPLRVVSSGLRYSLGESYDVLEADGTRVAIVAKEPDGDLVAAALTFVLELATEPK